MLNQERIGMLGKEECYKCLGILEADTIKQMKKKEEKYYLRRTKKLLKIKLSRRNLIKKINPGAVHFARFSGPFFKCTKERGLKKRP